MWGRFVTPVVQSVVPFSAADRQCNGVNRKGNEAWCLFNMTTTTTLSAKYVAEGGN
jgi:hypothetical protein